MYVHLGCGTCILCVGMCVVAIKDASCPSLSACSLEIGSLTEPGSLLVVRNTPRSSGL